MAGVLDFWERHSPTELLLLIELVGTWWKREEPRFPSIKTLPARCGISDRQVQRAIGNLERRGLLQRTKRRSNIGIIASNAYDLKPATALLEEVARMSRMNIRGRWRECNSSLACGPITNTSRTSRRNERINA